MVEGGINIVKEKQEPEKGLTIRQPRARSQSLARRFDDIFIEVIRRLKRKHRLNLRISPFRKRLKAKSGVL